MLVIILPVAFGAAYVGWVGYWVNRAKNNDSFDNEWADRNVGRY
jgi:hypothetical protein